MLKEIVRYSFAATVAVEDVEAAILLAIWGCEAQTRLHAAHYLDVETCVCVIDATTPVGHDLNRLFLSFVWRECGEEAIRVERVDAPAAAA